MRAIASHSALPEVAETLDLKVEPPIFSKMSMIRPLTSSADSMKSTAYGCKKLEDVEDVEDVDGKGTSSGGLLNKISGLSRFGPLTKGISVFKERMCFREYSPGPALRHFGAAVQTSAMPVLTGVRLKKAYMKELGLSIPYRTSRYHNVSVALSGGHV